MRILITGATGLLGSELMRQLDGQCDLVGWARRVEPTQQSQGLESVDITDEQAVEEGISRFKPDFVVHTAALSDVDACELDPKTASTVNADAPRRIGEHCARMGASLIAIGTDYVFDGKSSRPYAETDPTNPINQYGRSKLKGEQAVLGTASEALVVRVSGLFGASRLNFVLGTARNLRSGKPAQAVIDQTNSPTYTADLSAAIIRLMDEWQKDPEAFMARVGSARVLHMANDGSASRLEMAQEIAKCLKAPESLIEQTTWKALNKPARRPVNSSFDIRRLGEILGQPLRPWKEALGDFLKTQCLDQVQLP